MEIMGDKIFSSSPFSSIFPLIFNGLLIDLANLG